MKDRVSLGQLSLLLLLVISGSKFLSLPALLANDVGHDSWLVLCFSFLWDGICLAFLCWALKLNSKYHLSFDKILQRSVGKVASKILLIIFFVMFVSRSMMLLNSCYKMFAVTFDVSTNWVVFVLPIVAVSFFAIARGFNAIARMGQLVCVLIVICMMSLLSFTLMQTDFGGILPIAEVGLGKILQTSLTRSFWFSDYVFFYFVMDKVEIKRRAFSPVFACFAVGVLLTVVMNVIFVTLFGSLAPQIKLAMSKISVFSVTETTNGRWDWLTLSVWIMSVILKIVIFIFCAYKCLEKLFNLHFTKPNVICIVVIFILLMLPLFVSVERLAKIFTSWFIFPFAVVQYALPLAMPLLTHSTIKKMHLEVQK